MVDDQLKQDIQEVRDAAIASFMGKLSKPPRSEVAGLEEKKKNLVDIIGEHKDTAFSAALIEGFHQLADMFAEQAILFNDDFHHNVGIVTSMEDRMSKLLPDIYDSIRVQYSQEDNEERTTATASSYRYLGKVISYAIRETQDAYTKIHSEAPPILVVPNSMLNNILEGMHYYVPDSIPEAVANGESKANYYYQNEYNPTPPPDRAKGQWEQYWDENIKTDPDQEVRVPSRS